jgi:hypothetical protein
MSVHVGEVSSTVEVAPAGAAAAAAGPAGPGGPGGPGEKALAPTWPELERHRAMAAAEAESRARTEGGGFDV